MKRLLLLLFILCPIFAEQTPIAVNNLKGSGLSELEITILSDRLRTELFNTGVFIVMERAEMSTILKEMEFQSSGVCDEASCMVEMGQLLGVSKIVAGDIGKIGNFYTISLRIIDVSSGKIERAVSYDYTGEISELISSGLTIVSQKLAAIDTTVETSLANNTVVQKSPVHIDTDPLGTKLTINDTILLETPFTDELLPGVYELKFNLDGYRELSEDIRVSDGVPFDQIFTLKEERKRGVITRIVSGTIGVAALSAGIVFNGKVNSHTDDARELYNKAVEENNGESYHSDYISTKESADSATLTRNILYAVSGASVTVFAISFAF